MSQMLALHRSYRYCTERFRGLKRSDRRETLRQFHKRFAHVPHLDHPRSFSEKINRFKLEADRPLYRELADKLAVRDFVHDRLGEEALIPLLASGDRLTRELYADLPYRFVMKATHGSAMNRLVFDRDECHFQTLRRESDRWLCRNFYYGSRERQYRRIRPRLVFEQLMLDANGQVPADYKVHCFQRNGQRHTVIQVDSNRFGEHTRDYFTADWERLPLAVKFPNTSSGAEPERPTRLSALIEAAWQLAEGFAYVRVDLYLIDEKIYFGEMTFTPGSGFERFQPIDFDHQWGSWFDLDHQLSLYSRRDLEAVRRAS
ncbi:ATP-grasp fold amidoligase family protein [Kushneria phosphatilytica]|uniref:Glycosyltransferase n=1 Tax=Kushneria phosphatilytica TaxID=657387 RepID=A0A1S1NXK7_9GAMM|nr:ATP-grasp fold amidoligase family protein [Kushneria phosphatilytica]OHV12167.1 hypothetical protein BH688_05820 [Kushneria phosphatilytica]QEL11360.1 glycosyltransferase [Kushneria phosphatilytica]